MNVLRTIEARAVVLAGLAGSSAWATACTTLPDAVVHTAAAPDAPFARYRTFSFSAPPGAPPGYVQTAGSIDAQQKMKPLIAAALVEKGYVEVPEGADFVVSHGAGRRDAVGTRRRSRSGTALMGDSEDERSFLEGSLVVEVLDGVTHEEVWRGAATAEISGSRIDEERLASTVRRVMASFPARANATEVSDRR